MKVRIRFNIVLFLKIIIVLSVLSQIEMLSNYLRPAMYLGWILLGVFGIIRHKGSIFLSKPTVVFIVCYVAYLFLCITLQFLALLEIFVNYENEYISGAYLRTMLIPLAIVITMDSNSTSISAEDARRIIKIYVITAVIYAVYVNIMFFPSLTKWLNQNTYIFADKNSAAQIWSVAAVLSLFLGKVEKRKKAWIWKAISVYILAVIMLSQCRTAILGLILGYVFYLVFYAKRKPIHALIIAIIIVIALSIPRIYDYVFKIFFIRESYSLNLNTFSSGRLGLYKTALQVIKDNLLTGVGQYYVDCSLLMVLCETGIIGFFLVETIWLRRICSNIRPKAVETFERCVSVITIYYIVSSLLEGLPPFGPGVATFMFWMVSSRAFRPKIKRDMMSSGLRPKMTRTN